MRLDELFALTEISRPHPRLVRLARKYEGPYRRLADMVLPRIAGMPGVTVSGPVAYLPTDALTDDVVEEDKTEARKEIERVLSAGGYTVADYRVGTAIGPDGRIIRIGKILHRAAKGKVPGIDPEQAKQALAAFAADPTRRSVSVARQGKQLLTALSFDPVEAAHMSTKRGWVSCRTVAPRTPIPDVLVRDLESVTITAWLIREDDRRIDDPLARACVRVFFDAEGKHVLFIPEETVYGSAHPKWIRELQGLASRLNRIFAESPGVYRPRARFQGDTVPSGARLVRGGLSAYEFLARAAEGDLKVDPETLKQLSIPTKSPDVPELERLALAAGMEAPSIPAFVDLSRRLARTLPSPIFEWLTRFFEPEPGMLEQVSSPLAAPTALRALAVALAIFAGREGWPGVERFLERLAAGAGNAEQVAGTLLSAALRARVYLGLGREIGDRILRWIDANLGVGDDLLSHAGATLSNDPGIVYRSASGPTNYAHETEYIAALRGGRSDVPAEVLLAWLAARAGRLVEQGHPGVVSAVRWLERNLDRVPERWRRTYFQKLPQLVRDALASGDPATVLAAHASKLAPHPQREWMRELRSVYPGSVR